MSFAFVILNWNRAELTISAINNIESVETGEFGIIVVDNCSKPDERAKLLYFASKNSWIVLTERDADSFGEGHRYLDQSHPRILLLADNNYGYAKGNNLGLKLAFKLGFEWGVVMNNDVILKTPVVQKLIEVAAKDERIAVIGPRVIDTLGKSQGPFKRPTLYDYFISPMLYPISYLLDKIRGKRFRRLLEKHEVYFPYRLMGCFMVLRLPAMKEIDWFDENTFLYAEEMILSEKLIVKGFKTAYTGRVYVVHCHEATTSELGINRIRIRLESELYYLRKYRRYGKVKLFLVKTGFLYSQLFLRPLNSKIKKFLYVFTFLKKNKNNEINVLQ